MQDVADGVMETMQCWCDWERSLEHWGWAVEIERRTKQNAKPAALSEPSSYYSYGGCPHTTLLWEMSEVPSVPSEGEVGSDAQQCLGMCNLKGKLDHCVV